MSSAAISTPKVELPLTVYRKLERKLHEVRVLVMRRAAALAKKERHALCRADVVAALQDVATSPGSLEAPPIEPAQPADDLLERRLDRLRPLIIQMATTLANERRSSEPAARRVTVTPEDIDRAWKVVWNNESLRRAVLTRSDSPAPLPV